MKKIVSEKLICQIFCIMAIFVYSILFLYSMLETWINDWDLQSEYVKPMQDFVIGNIVWLAAVVLVAALLYVKGERCIGKINMDILAIIVCIMVLGFCVYWVHASAAAPQADQVIVYNTAQEFENGDYTRLNKGKYVGIYRHQLGLITFWRLLFKLFGGPNYQIFQYLNALMIPVMIFSGYRITKQLTEHNKLVELFYLILMVTCVPLYCYVPFVYGEVISTALIMFAAWMLMDTFEKFSFVKIGLMSIALGVAVQFRRNSLIFLIAFLIVTVIQLFRQWNWKKLVTIAGIFLCTILFQAYINGIYAKLIPENSHEAPASVYIAMGTNFDNGMAGWHNFYDQRCFKENDHNVERTNQVAFQDFKEFFAENDLGYLANFYYHKIGSQWNGPMYQCLAMNNKIKGEQSPLVASVYYGKLRSVVEAEMNIHQLVIYGGALCLLMLVRKRWQRIDKYLLLIGVFGGFLFSILWEAKTRYVFPYYLVMIPYGAVGVYELVKWLHEICRKYNKTSDKKDDKEDIGKEVAV